MRNYWLVAKHEYRRMVFRRGFVLATILIPVGMALIILFAFLVETYNQDDSGLGYVDTADIFDPGLQDRLPDPEDRVEITEFDDESLALAALEAGEIQAFFIFPSNYPDVLDTDLHFDEDPPSSGVWREFDDFVRLNLLSTLSVEKQKRLFEGAEITVVDLNGNREFSESAIINIILPFAGTFFFLFATMMAAGYLMGVVASEKENRTMEIVISSVTPGQLIGGKAVGLLGGALTQLTVYLVAIVIALKVASPYVEMLQLVEVPWTYLGLMLVFFLPSYALIASIMIAIGGAVTESQQGQQVAGILNLFFLLPIFLLPLLFTNPGHPAIVAMTIFPPTAFLTISLRWGLGSVPFWQLGLSWVLLVMTMFVMLWIAVRIFRAGMLRYGQHLSVKGALASLRGQ
ncbi:MAG TPA: ABC transporter permease [candidate division Zixibacteria bacterium]|nr:ABC transporter permease [candidate division Zixibacteria bacterium]